MSAIGQPAPAPSESGETEPIREVEPEPANPIAPRVAAHLDRLKRSLLEAGRRTHRQSDDDAVHDLRVTLRRQIVSLGLWRELFRSGSRKRVTRRLRSLRRRLGASRELEVHVAMLERLVARGQSGAGSPVIQAFLDGAHQRLAKERRQASDWLRPRRLRDLVDALDRASSRIERRAVRHPEALEQARGRLLRRSQDAVMALGLALQQLEGEPLHQARIAVKKWRYAIEAFPFPSNVSEGPSIESLRELQNVLGVIQDDVSLQAALIPEGGDPADAPVAVKQLIETLDLQRSVALDRFLEAAPAVLRRVNLAIVG